MNRNSPDYYREVSTDQSIHDTKELISYIRSLNSDLVHPVLTPRFAISCTDDLLFALGRLAKQETSLAIQTHISENKGEIFDTQKLFPKCSSYADVYYQHGLLTERTILGHGVHLGESELNLIAETRSGISHCPTSNFNLSSGMARVGEMLDRGIKVFIAMIPCKQNSVLISTCKGWPRNRRIRRILSVNAHSNPTRFYVFQNGRNSVSFNQ